MVAFWKSLSGRLLFLTVCFVMIAELLIFVPSIAKYRIDYLQERLEMGELAGLAQRIADAEKLTPELRADLNAKAGVLNVALHRQDRRTLVLDRQSGAMVDETYDLRDVGLLRSIWDAAACLWFSEPRIIRVIGVSRMSSGDLVDVTLEEWRLKEAMLAFALRILWLSLAISGITALLVYLSVHRFLVGPMSGVIASIVSFREDPEDASRIMTVSGAGGELGLAERELAETQREVRAALRQKRRLAALGEAVAKINHDLRNMLASAQLMVDRLEMSRDPMVARVSPKLISSLDRAIRLCQQTLAYGRADEAPPTVAPVDLSALVDDLRAALGLADDAGGRAIRFENRAPANVELSADSDQLFRALLNLARNSVQAIEAKKKGVGVIAVEARRAATPGGGQVVEIDLIDDGPGLPKQTRKDLFKPFKGSEARGGSGLGVAIAAELMQGHGGSLDLVESTDAGTRFRLTIPQTEAPVKGRRVETAAA